MAAPAGVVEYRRAEEIHVRMDAFNFDEDKEAYILNYQEAINLFQALDSATDQWVKVEDEK